jgi:DNA adenine methylase
MDSQYGAGSNMTGRSSSSMARSGSGARSTAAPFLKWAGGKGQLRAELRRRMPADYRTYHEPFVGGGALFFDISPQCARLSDVNAELMECYSAVQREPEALIARLKRLARRTDGESYRALRERYNRRRDDLAPGLRSAYFIYLNKVGFNGLHRVNRDGGFNVPHGNPYGKYPPPVVCNPDNFRRASEALRGVVLAAAPFEAVLKHAQRGDFVYFDPPYVPRSPTAAFTSYQAHPFGEAEQARLADVFRRLDADGCLMMLSNSAVPSVRCLYAGYRIECVGARRNINCDGGKRGKVGELIIRNY